MKSQCNACDYALPAVLLSSDDQPGKFDGNSVIKAVHRTGDEGPNAVLKATVHRFPKTQA
jgi:hypothetical protein